MNPRTLALALSTLLLLCASACGGEGTESDQGCVPSLQYSVTVTVLDSSGSTVTTDVTVEYAVDGGAAATCVRGPESFACGLDQAGTFVITATRGAELGTSTVMVTKGKCQVNAQTATITLSE